MIQVFQAVRDTKGNIIDFIWILNNAISEKIYGDVIGQSLLENDPGIKDIGIFDTFVVVTETGIAAKHERHYTHGQFEGWYYQSVVKLNDGVATTMVNITERKKAEMQLQEGRDRLRSILDTTLVQMSILEAVRDINGKIVDLKILAVNKELEKETGRNDLVNKLYMTEYPGIREAGLFDLIVKAIDTGEPQNAEYFYPHENFHKWFSCTFVKFGDGVVATNMDITGRKSADEERFKNYLLLKQSEEIASLGSWEYDILSSKLHWSDGMYRLFQLDHHLNVSPAVYLEHSTSSGKKNAKHVLRHIQKGDRDLDKTVEISIKGKARTLVIRATVLRNEQGQPVKVLGVDMDVTAMRETEKKLLKMRSEQQLEIFRETLKVQEEERRRISESLHNGLSQLLYGIKISLTDLEAKDAINDPKSFFIKRAYTDKLLSDAIKESRRISHELMPTILEEFGLQAAIDDIGKQLSNGVRFKCSFIGLNRKLPQFMVLAVYRTVQELMLNIVKHAKASRATTSVIITDKFININVIDDGKGMPNSPPARPGIGLKTIKSKIKLLNGTVKIRSSKDRGTAVEVKIPYLLWA